MNMTSDVLELNKENKTYKIRILIHFKFLIFFRKLSDLLQLQV
jgi:hypothetical protein